MRRRALVAALVAIGTLIATAAPAGAHAQLDSTEPVDGSVLSEAPKVVTLHFDEEVSVELAHVEARTSSGDPIATGPVRRGASSADLVVSLPPLARDAYRISYEVRDPVDLHLTTGSIVFGVGEVAVASADRDDPVRPIEPSLGWLGWMAQLLAIGALSVVLLHAPAISDPEVRRLVVTRSLRLVSLGLMAAVAARAVSLGVLVMEMRGGMLALLRRVLLNSGYGVRFLVSVQLTVAALAMVRWSRSALVRRAGRRVSPSEVGPVAMLAGLLLVAAIDAHAGSSGGTWIAGLALRTAHLAGIGLWIGGLGALVLCWPRAAGRAQQQLLASFAPVALGGAIVTVASGLALSGREVASLTALLSTLFGRVLTAKVLLVGLVFGLAGRHARRIVGGRAVAWRSLVAELAVATVVVAGGAVLGSTPPAVGPRFSPTESPPPEIATQQVTDLLVRFAVRPNRPGRNTIDLAVLDTRRPAPGSIESVTVVLTTGDGDPIRRTGERGADGTVSIAPVDLIAPGALTAAVTIDRPDAPVTPASLEWDVDRVPAPRAPTVVSDAALRPVLDGAGLSVLGGGLLVVAARRRQSRRRADARSEDRSGLAVGAPA